jgi:hypothetical protein
MYKVGIYECVICGRSSTGCNSRKSGDTVAAERHRIVTGTTASKMR